jgi:hypothetical protein
MMKTKCCGYDSRISFFFHQKGHTNQTVLTIKKTDYITLAHYKSIVFSIDRRIGLRQVFEQNSCLAPALGGTKFIIVTSMILVTLCCAT